MEHLPFYISLLFGLTAALSVFIFYNASGRSKSVLWFILGWAAVQAVISLSGFYENTQTIPPRFILSIAPPVLLIAGLFATQKGRQFIDRFNTSLLTILHVVRIPVEIVLLWLFFQKVVPGIMTFEGRNFDILSGLSALLVYYLMYRRRFYNRNILLVWNFICLGLLVNIVAIAILSAPFVFQRLAFDQPNIALLYFPFIWLPSIVVPIVLFSHLASIRKLIREKKKANRLVVGTFIQESKIKVS